MIPLASRAQRESDLWRVGTVQMAKTRLCYVGVTEDIGGSGRDFSGVTCEVVTSGRIGGPPLQALANILGPQKDWSGPDRICADQCTGHIWLQARPILPWFCR